MLPYRKVKQFENILSEIDRVFSPVLPTKAADESLKIKTKQVNL